MVTIGKNRQVKLKKVDPYFPGETFYALKEKEENIKRNSKKGCKMNDYKE